MKKLALSLILMITLLLTYPGYAEESSDSHDRKVSDEMIEILSQNLDNLFPITVQRHYFNEPEQPLYSDDGSETIIETYSDHGKRYVRIFANNDYIHDHFAVDFIPYDYQTDFQLTMDIEVNDAWPLGQGGCMLGFTNDGVSAFSDAESIAVVTDSRNLEIYHKNKADDAGTIYMLETRGKSPIKLSLVHMTGHTYVYVDGTYAGQLHDGLNGPFRLMYGSVLFNGGESAWCTFDNLVIRKLEKK